MKLHRFLSVPAALLIAGCATTTDTTTETTEYAATEPVVVEVAPIGVEPVVLPVVTQLPAVLNSVEFISPALQDRVVVTHTTYERTPSRAFRVLCTLRNLTNEPIRVQARTQYFSEDRMHQEGPGAWQIVYLPANGMETYTAYSYGTNLSHYYVEVQEM